MRVPVAPFLTAPLSSMRHDGWSVVTSGYSGALPAELASWDFQAALGVSAHVWIDRSSILDECHLGKASALRLVVLAHSDTTRIENAVALVRIPEVDVFDGHIECDLNSSELGGRLTLETILVTSSPAPRDLLAPAQPGSILWRTKSSVRLEGIGAQFPTDTSDFSISRPKDADAGWILEVDLGDLDALFMAAARLTLNSAVPVVKKMLQGSQDEEVKQLRRVLHWDVTRQMVIMALENQEVPHSEFDPEATSVGSVLRNLLSSIWPADSPVTVRNWWRTDPSRVEIRIQNRSGLFGE